MTRTDVLSLSMDTAEFMQKSPEMTTCDVVSSAIGQAAMEGRLIHGLSDCVTALKKNPNDVVICILPMNTNNDVNQNIQRLLIESICLEYDILILKLDVNVLQSGMSSYNAVSETGTLKLISGKVFVSSDLDCFLIQSSTEGIDCSDKKLIHLFQDIWNDHQEMPE
uniref:Ribosomal protein L7Ae/L30e/S12e/Gadd45 domain-containing protein n=1 Tax=Arion vulgaris TaxID=1028688 RepID=A0A0B7BA61_9EUPU